MVIRIAKNNYFHTSLFILQRKEKMHSFAFMMSKLLYYLIIFPASFLPLKVIYLFTDFFYLLLITIIPYRRKVIRENLKKSFPKKSNSALRKIERRFYRHFTDLLAEGVKNLSISEKELIQRFKVKNPEVMHELFKANKSVLLVSGHYNNWEWLITAQQLLFDHKAVGIGMPLSNGFWDKKINARRARFGMKIIHSKTVHSFFEHNKKTTATLVLSDQSPGDSRKAYWMTFLHQQTAVLFGAEMLANKYNQAVVFFKTEKVKRGYYQIALELITDSPRELSWGKITEKHVKLLEMAIMEHPEYWLWSHKRWKREVPMHLDRLKEEQKEKFETFQRSL